MRSWSLPFFAVLLSSTLAFVACGEKESNFKKKTGGTSTPAPNGGAQTAGTLNGVNAKIEINKMEFNSKTRSLSITAKVNNVALVNNSTAGTLDITLSNGDGLTSYSPDSSMENFGKNFGGVHPYVVAKCVTDTDCNAALVSVFTSDASGQKWNQLIGMVDPTGMMASRSLVKDPLQAYGKIDYYYGYPENTEQINTPPILPIDDAEKFILDRFHEMTLE